MKFKHWLCENDETQERTAAFQQYAQAITALATKYNSSIHPDYLAHEKKTFMTMPIEQLRQEIANMPKFLKEREDEFIRSKRDREEKERREAGRFQGYYQADSMYERVVCSRGDPGYHTAGMKAYPMEGIDPDLKGYYGVHVGSSAWLGILKRDGYCDDGDAYVYTIHAEEMIDEGIPVYIMEDPHVSYRDDATPESWIIFSEKQVIPAKYIELDQVIPEDEIEEAPPPYGME